ncbi:MAG: hypothetical protein AB7P69_18485 [Candidatus Binatia bacterium]
MHNSDNDHSRKERDSDIANAEIALRRAALKARERARRAGLKIPVFRNGQIVEEWPEEQNLSDGERPRVAEQEVLDLLDESAT